MTAPDSSKSIRTPLARVRGLGASHSGTGDFWRQRLTAVKSSQIEIDEAGFDRRADGPFPAFHR